MFEGDARAEGVCLEWRVVCLEWRVVCFRIGDVFEWRVFVFEWKLFVRVEGCLLEIGGLFSSGRVFVFE